MKKKYAVALAVTLLLVVALVFRGKIAARFNRPVPAPSAADEKNQAKINEAVAGVQQLLTVPENEQPLVAEVIDEQSLRAQQAFYANVRNGDYLLIYSSIGKAVIYRPSERKLVNVGPVEMGSQASSSAAAP